MFSFLKRSPHRAKKAAKKNKSFRFGKAITSPRAFGGTQIRRFYVGEIVNGLVVLMMPQCRLLEYWQLLRWMGFRLQETGHSSWGIGIA